MLVWEEAHKSAEELLEKFLELKEYKVDLDEICEYFGISVSSQPLKSGVSGYIQKTEKDEYPRIVLNSFEARVRQRFTLAHELGHYVERCIQEDASFTFIDKRGGDYDIHEFFADQFAGALLMPEKQFCEDVNGGLETGSIAEKYGVSKSAVKVRKQVLQKLEKLK